MSDLFLILSGVIQGCPGSGRLCSLGLDPPRSDAEISWRCLGVAKLELAPTTLGGGARPLPLLFGACCL
eukprot:7754989-Pyramimonas_sp.AAC.1